MRDINVTGGAGRDIKIKGDTKKNTKITISIGSIVVIVAAIFIWLSATSNLEKKIIGTWQVDEQPQIYVTFGENAYFSISNNIEYLEGNYSFLGDNTIQAHMSYLWADIILSCDISIDSGDKMTITNINAPYNIFGVDNTTITLTKTK